MEKFENNFWSDSRPYYILYQDKSFLKNIYAQLFSEYPDIGQIAYIGTNSRRISKDYSIDGEEINGLDLNKNVEKTYEDNYNKNTKQDNRKRAGVTICDSNEERKICEYSNIEEIKEMNNMLFYRQILKKLLYACSTKKCKEICHIKGRICMYDKYKEENDVFIKMENTCVWLKKEFMDTTAMNMSHILGEVHLLGYILEEKAETHPRVVKALAIYT